MGEKIKDRKAKDEIRNIQNQSKIKTLMKHQQQINISKNKLYSKMNKDIVSKEVIVVFETVQNRNE